MNVLSRDGLHDIDDESWNAYGQSTYISSWKLPFYAAVHERERQHQLALARPPSGASPWQLHALLRRCGSGKAARPTSSPRSSPSDRSRTCTGIGGAIQNFELQKTGSATPSALPLAHVPPADHRARRRAASEDVAIRCSSATVVDSRRLVLTAGNFTRLDVFDKNNVTGDPRQTFLNMAFMTHASWDFAADARGYSLGGAAELVLGRLGAAARPDGAAAAPQHAAPSTSGSGSTTATSSSSSTTTRSSARPARSASSATATTRYTGRFADAIAAFAGRPRPRTPPTARPPRWLQLRLGQLQRAGPLLGAAAEREGGHRHQPRAVRHRRTSAVLRAAMYSDGQSEVDAFNSADRILVLRRRRAGDRSWHRPFDVAGRRLRRELDLRRPRAVPGDGRHRRLHRRRPPQQAARERRRRLLQLQPVQGDLAHGRLPVLWNPASTRTAGPSTSSAGGSMWSSEREAARACAFAAALLARGRASPCARGERAAAGAGVRRRAPLPVGAGRRLVRHGRPRHARRARRGDGSSRAATRTIRCASRDGVTHLPSSRTRRFADFGFAATYDRFRALPRPRHAPRSSRDRAAPSAATSSPPRRSISAVAPRRRCPTRGSASTRACVGGPGSRRSAWAPARSSRPRRQPSRLRHRRHVRAACSACCSRATWAASRTRASSACTSARSTTRRLPGSPQGSELLFGVAGGARLRLGDRRHTRSSSGPRSTGETAFRSLLRRGHDRPRGAADRRASRARPTTARSCA